MSRFREARAACRTKEVTAGIPTDDHLEGFRSMEHLPRVTQGLLDRGVAEGDVQKVIGANFMRVFAAVWKDRANLS